MNSRKLALMGLILALLGSFFVFDLGQYLNLEALKAQQAALNAQVASNPNGSTTTQVQSLAMRR